MGVTELRSGRTHTSATSFNVIRSDIFIGVLRTSECRFRDAQVLKTSVLGLRTSESSFNGTRVLKLSDSVLRMNESSSSDTRVLKLSDLVFRTPECSFSESDCGNTVLDRTTTTSLVKAVVPSARRL